MTEGPVDGARGASGRPGVRPGMSARAGAGAGREPGEGESWTVLGMIRWSAGYLEGKGVEAPQARLDSEHLLAHALDVDRLQLYLQFERPLTPAELARYKPLLLRRAAREPLQYILGRGPFRELDLRVDGRVLIPRPETEELVEAVLEWARERTGAPRHPPSGASGKGRVLPWSSDATDGAEAGAQTSGDATRERDGGPPGGPAADLRRLTALDVGTGSGCIALSLALEGPFERVVASDPSEEALELARENAREAGLADRVDFRQGGLFDAVPEMAFDVVVSNPPYVAEEEAPGLPPEVREHEPGGALFAGPGGLAVLEPLVGQAGERVVAGGLLALETGHGQAERVAELIRATGSFEEPRIRRDLSGRPRIVTAVRKG